MPSINAENTPYVLQSCLGKGPADTVKSVHDYITAMWKRLDEKYGDPAKVADVLMCAILNIKPIAIQNIKISQRRGKIYQ